jgi:hypothetical protein
MSKRTANDPSETSSEEEEVEEEEVEEDTQSHSSQTKTYKNRLENFASRILAANSNAISFT